MGAIDTGGSKPIYLSFSKGMVHAYDGDTAQTSEHKGWEGYIVGMRYETDPERARFGAELHVQLHDGDRPAVLKIPMKSGSFRQFCTAVENLNLRQPVTFRPWYKESESGKAGGVNLFQGPRRVLPKYTKEEPQDMPALKEVVNPVTNEKTIDGTERLVWMKGILDTRILPMVAEVVELGAWEEAPKPLAPMISPKTIPAALPMMAGGAQSETTGTASDGEDDLPF